MSRARVNCIRRFLSRAINSDVFTRIDLSKQAHQPGVLFYSYTFKPFVLVMMPPCTSFGRWSHLIRYLHPGGGANDGRLTNVLRNPLHVYVAYNCKQVGISS